MIRIVVLALAIGLGGQQAKPQPVADARKTIRVIANGDDAVGLAVVYALREQLGKSSLYRLVDKSNDASFLISMSSLDAGCSTEGIKSTFATLLLNAERRVLYFNVHIAGRTVAEATAADLLARFDDAIRNSLAK